MKLNLFCTNPEEFLRGEYNYCWYVTAREDLSFLSGENILVHTFDFDPESVDRELFTAKTLDAIDAAEDEIKEKAAEKLELLAQRRQELLCLEAL